MRHLFRKTWLAGCFLVLTGSSLLGAEPVPTTTVDPELQAILDRRDQKIAEIRQRFGEDRDQLNRQIAEKLVALAAEKEKKGDPQAAAALRALAASLSGSPQPASASELKSPAPPPPAGSGKTPAPPPPPAKGTPAEDGPNDLDEWKDLPTAPTPPPPATK